MSTSLLRHLFNDYSFLSNLLNKPLNASALADCEKFHAYHGLFDKDQLANLRDELVKAVRKIDTFETFIASREEVIRDKVTQELNKLDHRSLFLLERDIATAKGLLEDLQRAYTPGYRTFMYLVLSHNERGYLSRLYNSFRRSVEIYYQINFAIRKKQ